MSAVHQQRRRYQHASEAFHQRQRSRPSFKRCKTFFGMCGGGLYVCNLAEKTDTVPSPRFAEKGFAKFWRYTHCKKVRLLAYGTRGDMLVAEISFYATCLCWSTAQQIFLRVQNFYGHQGASSVALGNSLFGILGCVCSQSVNDVVAETQRGGPSKGIFCVDEIVLFTLYAWLTSQPSKTYPL